MGLKEETIIKIIEECIKPLSGLKNGFEKQENRADEIAENLPPEKYPSVSAVIAFVKNKIEVFSEAVGKVYLKATDFEDYKTDASNTYAKKTDVEEFENNVAKTYATKTDVEDFENNVAKTYATKTDVEDFENNVADTYAKKTDVEDFENNVADTYATKTDVEDFENNVADTYATKTDVEDFENNVADTYATKTDVEDFENNVADTYATKNDVENLKTDTEVIATATGSAITIESSQAPLQNLKLYGKTEQDGTPTPTSPIELKSVGDSGSFEVGVYEKSLIDVKATTQTISGVTFTVNANKSITCKGTATGDIAFRFTNPTFFKLPKGKYKIIGAYWSIEIYLDGVYERTIVQGTGVFEITNENCKLYPMIWISKGAIVDRTIYPMLLLADETDTTYEPCNKQTLTITDTLCGMSGKADEYDFTKETKKKYFKKYVLTGNENWWINSQISNHSFSTDAGAILMWSGLCSHYPVYTNATTSDGLRIGYSGYVIITDSRFENDIAGFKAFLAEEYAKGTPVTVVVDIETPIETPLTETELNAYRSLMTNSGNTTILSEADMEVDYYINKPNAQAIGNIHSQVNKDYFKLQQAIISTGGN